MDVACPDGGGEQVRGTLTCFSVLPFDRRRNIMRMWQVRSKLGHVNQTSLPNPPTEQFLAYEALPTRSGATH